MGFLFVFSVFIFRSFGGNPNNCPISLMFNSKQPMCDISCCISMWPPGIPFDDFGKQEPPHRLGFWNENVNQKNHNQCGYCYVQFKNQFSNFANDFHTIQKNICPNWIMEKRSFVTIPDGSQELWMCPEGYTCVLVKDPLMEASCKQIKNTVQRFNIALVQQNLTIADVINN